MATDPYQPNAQPPQPTWGQVADFTIGLIWPVLLVQFFVVLLLVIPGQGQEVLRSATEAWWGLRFLVVALFYAFLLWILARTILGYNARGKSPLSDHSSDVVKLFRFAFPAWISIAFLVYISWHFSSLALILLIVLAPLAILGWDILFVTLSAIVSLGLFISAALSWISPYTALGYYVGVALLLAWGLSKATLEWSRWFLVFSSVIAIALFGAAYGLPILISDWIGEGAGPYGIIFLGSLLILIILLFFVHLIHFGGAPLVAGLAIVGLIFFISLKFGTGDDHQIRLCSDNACGANGHSSPIASDQAISQWQKENSGKTMIIVAAAGGGIRAAYWTGSVLGALQDDYPEFGSHLFAISAVSGGALGAASFDAALDSAKCKPRGPNAHQYKACLKEFLSNDFLSPIVTSMFTRDIIRQVGPLVDDRATVLEWAWEHAWKVTFPDEPEQVKTRFERPFDALWNDPDKNANEVKVTETASYRPALLFNGTSADSGKRLVTSNLMVKDRRTGEIIDNPAVLPIRLSTAVDNSTRFPLIEPAGGIPFQKSQTAPVRMDHVVDGGYFDNYGADTLLDILQDRDKNQRLIVIQITSDPEIADRLDAYKGPAIDLACRQGSFPSTQPVNASPSGDLATLFHAAFAARSWTGLVWAEQLRDMDSSCREKDHPIIKKDFPVFQWFHFGMRCKDISLGWRLSSEAKRCIDDLLTKDAEVTGEMKRLLIALNQ